MRKITFETDFNHKLHSDTFVHITQAPASSVPEHALEEPIIVELKDNPSFKAVVKVMDIQRLPLHQLVNAYTLPSHGLYAWDFIEWWRARYPDAKEDTPMAVYYFQKHTATAV